MSFANAISIKTLQGSEIAPYAKGLSSFFMKMYQDESCYFSEEEWDGYIQSYVNTDESVVSLALLDDTVVGAALGTPLAKASEKYRKPFFGSSDYLNSYFYLGDLAIKQEFRKVGLRQKVYHAFEAKIKNMERFAGISFWQEDSHNQIFTEVFLRKQGFTVHPEFYFEEFYKDAPFAQITLHPMISWIKRF
jgi:hypothetical protein